MQEKVLNQLATRSTEQIMSETTMPKAYNHMEFEENLHEWWLKNGFFRPEQQLASGLADPNAEPFVISMRRQRHRQVAPG